MKTYLEFERDIKGLEEELEKLKNNVDVIAENSNKQISSLSIAKKNVSNLIKSFDSLKDLRKRILFKIRAKRGVNESSDEYWEFFKKIISIVVLIQHMNFGIMFLQAHFCFITKNTICFRINFYFH